MPTKFTMQSTHPFPEYCTVNPITNPCTQQKYQLTRQDGIEHLRWSHSNVMRTMSLSLRGSPARVMSPSQLTHSISRASSISATTSGRQVAAQMDTSCPE